MMINHHSFDNTPLFEVLNTPGDHSVPSGLNLAKKNPFQSHYVSPGMESTCRNTYTFNYKKEEQILLSAETYRH